MEMDDKGIFEKEWSDAFSNAEVNPSPSVWEGVELVVANERGALYQKRFLMMRRVAAAAILIALFAGVVGVMQWQSSSRLQNELIGNNATPVERQLDPINLDLSAAVENTETSGIGNQNAIDVTQKQIDGIINQNAVESKQNQNERIDNQIAIDAAQKQDLDIVDQIAIVSIQKQTDRIDDQNAIDAIQKKDLDIVDQIAIVSIQKQTAKIDDQNAIDAIQNQTGSKGGIVNRKDAVGLQNIHTSNDPLNDKHGDNSFIKVAIMEEQSKADISQDQVSLIDSSQGVFGFAAINLVDINPLGLTQKPISDEVEMNGVYIFKYTFDKEEDKRGLWAGLDIVGGIFSPNGSGLNFSGSSAEAITVNTDQVSNLYNVAAESDVVYHSSGISGNTRGYGIGVGAYISNKVILQGAIQYASVYAGRYVGTDASLLGKSVEATRNNFYDASNTGDGLLQIDAYNFLSLPIRVGYSIFDGDFNISVNPGLDSRFYINKSTQRHVNGNSSLNASEVELNPVTFWGELSTDFTYKLGDHYMLAVSPAVKMAINSLEKGSDGHASLAEVSFSMRYLFDN